MNKQKDLNKDKSLEDTNEIKSSSTSSSDYERYVRLGESIGDVITSKWNSQKKPGKVYIKNRRVHHGEVGAIVWLGVNGFGRRGKSTYDD